MTNVRMPRDVRNILRKYAEKHDLTYNEAVLDLIPEEEVMDLGPTVLVDLDDEAYERLSETTGDGVDRAEVMRYYLPTEEELEDTDNE